jgi:hypothetical protein
LNSIALCAAFHRLQRILKVDYHIPSHIKLSPEGHDLLRRVLVADPAQRINVAQIYDHPWYCKNLPPGVKEMNDRPQPLPEGLQSVEEISRIVQVRRACCLSRMHVNWFVGKLVENVHDVGRVGGSTAECGVIGPPMLLVVRVGQLISCYEAIVCLHGIMWLVCNLNFRASRV